LETQFSGLGRLRENPL